MKKAFLLSIVAVGAVLFALGAGTNEVTSVNVVGYTKITIPASGAYAMFAMPFDPVSGGITNYFSDVFGTNQLAQHTLASLADRIFRFNGAGYDVFYQKTDGFFYSGSTATNPTMLAGEAYWIRQPNAAASPKEITIMGEVVPVATQMVDMVADYQMIGYPYSTQIGLNQTGFKDSPGSTTHETLASLADRIYIFNGAGYDVYGLQSDGWHHSTGYATNAPTNIEIPMGGGFWYRAKSGGWTWAETNKYIGNL